MTQHRTGFNVVAISAASLLQILNQFLFFAVNARHWGADAATDPLLFAIALPVAFSSIITGSLSYVLVPQLVSSFERPGEKTEAWQLAAYVGMVTLVASTIVGGFIYWAALPLAEWLMEQKVEGQHAAAARYLQILSIQVVLFGLISWAQAVLHSRHKFLFAAAGGVLGTGVQLLVVLAIGHWSLDVIAWSINLGSVISLVIHLIPIVPNLRFPKASSAKLVRLFASLWPLVVGALFLRLDPLVDRIFASELDPGSLTHISWAHRIHAALLALGASSLSLVAFPQLAEHYARDGQRGFCSHFALCARRAALLIVPIAVGVSCFSLWIIRDLLEGGQFSPSDTARVGWLVVAFMGLFVGASVAELLSRGFYVLGDTRTPTFIGVACLFIGLVAKYLLFQKTGIWGIALGVSFYYLLTAIVLAVALQAKSGGPLFSGVGWHLFQAFVASLLACAFCYVVYSTTLMGDLLEPTWIAAPIGAVVYFFTLLAFKNSEARQFWLAATKRWTQFFSKGE